MRALAIASPGMAQVVERPEPIAGAGEVLLTVARVGLCGTDLSSFLGKNPLVSYPRVIGHEIAGVSHVCITSRGADQLRDLTVAVLPVQVILVPFERVGELVVLEAIRQVEPAAIARVRVEVREDLVHPAMLGVEHPLKLFIGEMSRRRDRPI